METIYIPDEIYVAIIQTMDPKPILSDVNGHARWILTKEDGTQIMYRPESTNEQKPN